jgi:pimeloyl-ACP methyl ester carboxylesterase
MKRFVRTATSDATVDDGWKAIDWTEHTADVLVRARRIHFVDIGAGPAVVLIHGQGGCWQWWLRMLPELAKHARVIAVDLPGFGCSDPVGADDVFDGHVAAVVGLLDHLGVAEAVIVGHSMGGLVSLRVAVEHPDRVAGLVLVNAGGARLGAIRLQVILFGLRIFASILAHRRVSLTIARTPWMRSALMAGAIHDKRYVTTELAVELLPRMASPGYVSSLRAAVEALHLVTPNEVQCPSLIVWGTRDRILPLPVGIELSTTIPDARLVTLPDVAHCPMIEVPDRVTELVAPFVCDPETGRPTARGPVPEPPHDERKWLHPVRRIRARIAG